MSLLTSHVVRFAAHTEHYLCASAPADPARVFGELAELLARERIQPLRETVYGSLARRAALLAARRAALRARGLEDTPAAYLEGRPPDGPGFAGLQLWGVRGRGSVRTVSAAGVAGRLWTAPGLRALHLCGARGSVANGDGRAGEAAGMFAAARAALAEHGFRYRQVARTWIYLARILDWYEEFNRVRTGLYARPEFLGGLRRPFPASTGIAARAGAGACAMDLLALSGSRVRPVTRSARQGPSFAYGSAFSRAAQVRWGGRTTLLVSGTASIDAAGRTALAGDAEGQCLRTLLALGALLAERGGSLRDIVSATVFCKDRSAHAAYRRVTGLLGIELPAVAILADICRPDLLVEIEATAVL